MAVVTILVSGINSVQIFDLKVRVHVIGAEIQQHGLTEREINVSLRVYLAGQCRSVLTHSGTATPRWNETLSFTVEKELIDLRETELEFKVVLPLSLLFLYCIQKKLSATQTRTSI